MSAYLAATLRGTYTARFMLIRILTLSMVWGTTFFLSFLSTRSGRLLSVSFSTLVPSRLSINQICVKFGQLDYCKENVYLLFFSKWFNKHLSKIYCEYKKETYAMFGTASSLMTSSSLLWWASKRNLLITCSLTYNNQRARSVHELHWFYLIHVIR